MSELRVFGVSLEGLSTVAEVTRARFPEEACGLGFGAEAGSRVTTWVPLENRARDPLHEFELDPSELLQALTEAGRHRRCLKVIFHSHPRGSTRLSELDRARAVIDGVALYPGVLYVVVSARADGQLRWAAHRFSPEAGWSSSGARRFPPGSERPVV